MFEDRILTMEPAHIKSILATQFNSFEKGPEFSDQLSALLGTGVFNADGTLPLYSAPTDVTCVYSVFMYRRNMEVPSLDDPTVFL
ncbi:hypothetical protein F5141DRAFT_1144648, partial [Pisolithus sp. B1]